MVSVAPGAIDAGETENACFGAATNSAPPVWACAGAAKAAASAAARTRERRTEGDSVPDPDALNRCTRSFIEGV